MEEWRRAVWGTHRGAVLHHGVVELVSLGGAAGEEAALADVVVEVLQTAVPAETGGQALVGHTCVIYAASTF